ncbi:urease accessory protein UreD [Brachybacterium fresconis]|uniref:Urease accessory protein n=1 Tax=Brachybacterium fresconis TaxID=173363 RepID=A0ABS4YNJ8_9MICO|nr:urease accessory protein UreD [Brachybacterium fresconis]MBP2410366.1 urease accessory protein [Brachybacterium fresconis]
MTRISIARAGSGPVRVKVTQGLLQARTIHRSATGAHLALVAGGAVLVGGDRTAVGVHVGAGCTLELEDIGGTVAYPSVGSRSRFDVSIRLEDDATLVWRAHPFVVAEGAAVDRSTTIVLGAGSSLCLRETLVLGRSAERGGEIRSRLRAHDAGGLPLHLEDLDLDGDRPRTGVLGPHRVLDSVLLLGGRLPVAPTDAMVLHLGTCGVMARAVADATHRTGVEDVITGWSEELLAGERPPV